ncbi:ester cyclase [Chloroflexi bacterium TSY]|nr:ester cyclase [Chloroflexi bacterium TSY]
MSTQENLDLVHRMYEALNAQDLEAHHEYWTENMIWHGPPGFGDIHGIDGFKYDVLKPFYTTFPDYHVVNEIEVANGDWVAATGILTGTPQDEWLGVPATGKPIVMRFSDFWRVENGKLAENWVMVDNLGVMQQLAAPEAEPRSPVCQQIYITPNEPTLAQQNLDLVHDMIEIINAHEIEAHAHFWTEDMIWHGPPGFGDIHGIEAFKQDAMNAFYRAFPDFHGEMTTNIDIGGSAIELADDHFVAATGIATGTHQGPWFNIPPTGKHIEIRYSDFWRIENGKLVENWVMIDHVGMLQQIGVDPLTLHC